MEIERTFQITRIKNLKVILTLIFLLILAVFVSILVGTVKIPFFEIFNPVNREIVKIRFARIILAIIAGGGLSVAGVILQGLLRNPLCEPYVLGISSGASLGAILAIVSGIGYTIFGFGILPLFAFLGAAIAFLLIYRISQIGGRIPIQNLLLTGVIVGAVLSSVAISIVYFSQREGVHNVMWWMLGNLQIFEFNLLISVAFIVASGVILSFIFSRELNAISLGEEEALHLGIDIERLKKILFLSASLITGAIVSATGMIGFIGLVVPHFMRLLVGPNHKVLIPSCLLAGGIFLVICDSISRIAVSPSEIPIGVMTAILGGPFFIYILRKKSKL